MQAQQLYRTVLTRTAYWVEGPEDATEDCNTTLQAPHHHCLQRPSIIGMTIRYIIQRSATGTRSVTDDKFEPAAGETNCTTQNKHAGKRARPDKTNKQKFPIVLSYLLIYN